MDVSNFSGTPTVENVGAVAHSQAITRVTIAAQFAETFDAWKQVCEALGLEYDAYVYLYNDGRGDYPAQTQWALSNIAGSKARGLWLDLEDQNPPTDWVAQAQAALETWHGWTGIYTSPGYWAQNGNPQLGASCPLWVASWGTPPQDTGVEFGGWLRARGKQYAGGFQSYGLSFDLNWWDV